MMMLEHQAWSTANLLLLMQLARLNPMSSEATYFEVTASKTKKVCCRQVKNFYFFWTYQSLSFKSGRKGRH